MSSNETLDRLQEASAWWSTAIIDVHPGEIAVRGYPIQDLIGELTFAEMAWLMLRGELPTKEQAKLLEAALVAGVDHGPHAPSIAISRMAVTCGAPINGAMASAINVLDDVHGGAGQQCMELIQAIAAAARAGGDLEAAVETELERFVSARGKIVPGFGHRWHSIDPRAVRLLELADSARDKEVVSGEYARIGTLIERSLGRRKGTHIPMNIDGVTAVIFCELGFAPELGRGLFILSRSVGILAHAWEQSRQGGRIKGPMPPTIPYRYTGPALRRLRPNAAKGAR
jgi:citrate synthase